MKRPFAVAVASFMLSALVAFQNLPSIKDRKIDAVFADLSQLRLSMDHRLKLGLPLPDESNGLRVLLDPTIKHSQLPLDQWGAEYVYRRVEGAPGYIIYSVGENGVDERGGGDDVTDITKSYSCEAYGLGCPMKADELLFFVAGITSLISLLVIAALTVLWTARRFRRRGAA